MKGDDLFAETETDARSGGLGGEEGYKDPFGYFRKHSFSIIGNNQRYAFSDGLGTDLHACVRRMDAGFGSILQQVDEDLFHLSPVGQEGEAGRCCEVKEGRRVEPPQVVEEGLNRDLFPDGRSNPSQFAIVFHEFQQSLAAAVNDFQSFLYMRSGTFVVWILPASLAQSLSQ